MLRAFRFIAERTSYCFAFVPFVVLSGYFAASYAFFIFYFSIESLTPRTMGAFGATLTGTLLLCTALHSLGLGVLERAGIRAGLALPRRINQGFLHFQMNGSTSPSELTALLRRLARFPQYHMGLAVAIALMVTLPSVTVEYAFSRSVRHLAAGIAGGLIAGVLYCYFCYVITEALSGELRSACRREIARQGVSVPGVYGISLRRKIGFTVTIVFFSMFMLVYFLVFCRASLVLTSGFLITTFFTVAVLVSLYFRSVKAAFDEILRTARRVSHGGGELLHLGSNEKELVEFAEHFNDSVCETIALRENLEVQVNERTRELSLKAEELAEANDRLRELDRLKSRFLSSVSHELRTPLTSILGFSQIILRDLERAVLPLLPESGNARAKADRICTNVGVIRREGERLTRLINGVLDLARIESGRMEWRDTWVGLSSCIEQAVQVVEGASDRNPDVMLKVQAESSLPKIFADPDRIVQVLVNLLNNAFKFTRNGEVRVSAGKGDTGELEVSVSDTGPGMPPEELDSVFERFHQVEGREGRPVGTGLGLAICREIVEHYGGRIRAESRIGRGCRFVFILPAGDSGRELFE